MKTFEATLICLFLLLTSASVSLAQGTYTKIDFPGAQDTLVRGINSAGELVGCYDTGDLNLHGFLLSQGTFTTIDDPGQQWTCWQGINDVGQLVGYAYSPVLFVGLVYDRQTSAITQFPPFPEAGLGTFGYGVNNAGTIVGGATKDNRQKSSMLYRGFTLKNGIYTTLEPSPGLDVWLTSINNLDEIVGVKQDGNGLSGSFLYRNGYFAKFLITGQPGAFAEAINDFGVIAGCSNPFVGHRAFVYDKGQITVLFFPGSDGNNCAEGINNSGVVVGTFLKGGREHGFLWTPPADAPKP